MLCNCVVSFQPLLVELQSLSYRLLPCDNTQALCMLVAVPGPVSSPSVNELGSHHVKLTWNKPQQINGIPRGYIIGYREGQQISEFCAG